MVLLSAVSYGLCGGRLAWRAAHNSARPGALGRAVQARRRGRARLPYAAHYHCDVARAEAHVYR